MEKRPDSVDILLVDDQEAKLLAYEAILSDLGENLIVARSAREALEYLLRHDVAVLLVDVCMPELDGFELAAMIREHPRYSETAIIFVSAVHMSDLDRLRGYQLGAVDYVSVPVVPEILRAKVTVFCELYRKTRLLEAQSRDLENRVEKSEERLKLALAAGGMATWDMDVQAGTAVWSDRMFRMLGYEKSPNGAATLGMWESRLHPSDRARVLDAFQAAVQRQAPYAMEHRILRADTGAAVWLSSVGRAMKEGDSVRFVGICFDVSERKLAAIRLATVHDMARALAAAESLEAAAPALLEVVFRSLEARVAAMWVPDEESNTLRCVHVATTDDVAGAAFVDSTRVLSATAETTVGRAWQRRRAQAIESVHDAGFKRRDGALGTDLRAGAAFPVVAEGRCFCVIEYFSDAGVADVPLLIDVLTAIGASLGEFALRKRFEAELREADRRKDEFLATLAHELRNPLSPILNALHLMGFEQITPAQRARSRDMIQRQIEHMVRLVDDLLDVSRISSGKITLRAERVDLGPMLTRAVEIAQPLLDARGVFLAVHAPDEPISVRGDLARLVQVVGNLLHNAAKFTSRGGEVRLRLERDGDEVVMRVEDTGIGIPPEMLPRVFDLFTQVRAGTGTESGLGIGLALARSLVGMHGGTITAHSDGLGHGATFVIRLPVLSGTRVSPRPPCESRPALADGAPRILVADDNADAADSLAMYLELRGHEVKIAYDGMAAVELAEIFQPRIVILDIGMPKLDGYDAARRIRAAPWGKGVALIAQTGWGQAEDRRRAREAGFDVHLTKPVDLTRLTRLIADLANGTHET